MLGAPHQGQAMLELQNVLYVVTQGTFLRLDHDSVRVDVEGEMRARFPLVSLSGIVVMGRVTVSPALIERCAEDGRSLVWLTRHGRFVGRVEGRTKGNVLLRRAQHLALNDHQRVLDTARYVVLGKMHNARHLLLRAARDATDPQEAERLGAFAGRIAEDIERAAVVADLETLRGTEGDAARAYFAAFPLAVRGDRDVFSPDGWTRRPPRDRMNSLLSFLYALVRSECTAALEGVGLDPQVGYLHSLRPGRPALALDLMEEFRPPVADRLALTLVNRRQVRHGHFEELPGGAIYLTEEGRRTVLTAYQQRKGEPVRHRLLKRTVPVGLLPHVQARLLARYLRGELDAYVPFVPR